MDDGTTTLTFRFGSSIEAPSVADMRRALHEVFDERVLGLPEGDLLEHPNTWLSRGYSCGDSWSVVTVDVYRGGKVILSKYADQDDDDPAYEHCREGLSIEGCLDLWRELVAGDEARLERKFTGGDG